jgi:hypothetical protein
MAKTKILITVKTYPTLSTKYDETVCTAGFLEDGSWIRIYPIPFRKKSYDQQYSKYDWIEVDIVKNKSDFRKESYRPATIDTPIDKIGEINTDKNWALRKQIVLNTQNKKIYTNLTELITEAQSEVKTSLAVFKPTKIKKFIYEPVEREWKKDKIEKIQYERATNLFAQEEDVFKIVDKLPYKFSYTFIDDEGRESTLMIEDWEIGPLYWKCLKSNEGDENKALAAVKKKYFDEFIKTKELYFFLGTTLLHHNTAPNPFVIIGVFYPKYNPQLSFDF